MIDADPHLRREVIAPDGPNRRVAVASYRKRRKAVARGKQFLASMRRINETGCAVDPSDVVDELHFLIKALEETL